MKESEIIASGTFGCVSRPSLKCKNMKNINYSNKVSKMMNVIDADDEYNEFKKIVKIPGIDKYTMPMPIICKPELNEELVNNFKECPNERVYSNPKKLRLLILEDGGVDLIEIWEKGILHMFNFDQWKTFLNSIIKLFEGIEFFGKNNIIHHDVKLPNIVYNVNVGEFKFIDFGIMITKPDFISSSVSGVNELAKSWEYFPKEYSCGNYNAFKTEKCNKYNKNMSYDNFIKKVSDTFDMYCLCYALHAFFSTVEENEIVFKECNETEKNNILSLCKKLRLLLRKYYTDIQNREVSIKLIRESYIRLLKKHDLYTNKISKPTPEIVKIVKKNSAKRYVTTKKKCPENKVINPVTGRCITKKLKKSISDKMKMPCPEKKIRNPLTGRCVKAIIVNKKNGGSRGNDREGLYEEYMKTIMTYYKNDEVPETNEDDDEKYQTAVDEGYNIYLEKNKGRGKKKLSKDKWVVIVKGISERVPQGGRRTKKNSRKSKRSRKNTQINDKIM